MREMKDSGVQWIGQIPDTWNTARIKDWFHIIGGNGFPEYLQGLDAGDYPFCKVSDINGSGSYIDSARNYVTKAMALENHFNIIPAGSFLFAKIGAALQRNHRKINIVDCCVDNNIEALVPKIQSDRQYMFYLLSCIDMGWFDNRSTIPSINNSKLLSFVIPSPSIVEQSRIAAYLDRRCATIDALIANQQQQIDKLKQYKQAVITEAVTCGLDPNVRMKDSGVEWIGEVPENWTICRIADLYSERSESGNDSLPILTVSINSGISDRELSNDEQDRVFIRSEDKSKYKRVYPGDLAYNMMRAWQGAFGAVRVDGMISPAYIVAKPRGTAEIDNRYFEALLRTPMAIEEMHRYSRGIMDFRLRLYWTEFRSIRVCLPSVDEQRSIADYLDTKCAQIDALIALKQQKADKLAQYKKSLIYEVVTGKREI